MNLLFYVSSAVAIASTIMVLTRTVPMHALLYLIVSLLAVALVFFSLGATFVAALEAIVYAGAIMVLFLFIIMLLNLGPQAFEQQRQWLAGQAWIGPGILALILLAELIYAMASGGARPVNPAPVTPKDVGLTLFGPYVLGVELASTLLMSGLIGAYHLGRRIGDQQPGEL